MGDVGISLLPLPAVAFNFMCKMVHSDHTDISIIQVSSKYHYEVLIIFQKNASFILRMVTGTI